MAEDGCRLLLEHKCSDSATDLGQQMLELYTDAKIEESEESLGESACHEGSSHRRHGGCCVDLHPSLVVVLAGSHKLVVSER